jgi:hypothetical protein
MSVSPYKSTLSVLQGLSASAGVIWSAMGRGFRLRIPHDGGPTQLIAGFRENWREYGPGFSTSDTAAIEELMQSGLISKLTEDRYHDRIGWREAGYDGDVADWWVCTQ